MSIGRYRHVFLDNMPFWYDWDLEVFIPSSVLTEERLTIQEVRRRGMVMCVHQVATYDGVPYVFVPEGRMLYRLGHPGIQVSEDEWEIEERGGPRERVPYGEAFRALWRKEMGVVERQQDAEKDR